VLCFGWAGSRANLFPAPLAEAVVFALIASYVLNYTLVRDARENYLFWRNIASHGGGGQTSLLRRAATPLVRFQKGFEHRFESIFASINRACLQLCLKTIAAGLIGGVLHLAFPCSPLVCPLPWGKNFFPRLSMGGQIKIICRAGATALGRIEQTTNLRPTGSAGKSTRCIRCGPISWTAIFDNIGLSVIGINMAYTTRDESAWEDADVLIA